MTTKYFKLHIILLLLAMLLFWGCNSNRDSENFTQTPSERIVQAKSELRNILTNSKDGWKMIYFTKDSEFGGYTHLMSFTPDGKVTMASDFNEDALTASASDYELQSSYAPNLVFTTKNKIHLLSDSNNSPGSQAGAGYKGDFEFVYQKTDEKGNIIFRTARSNTMIIFTKATADDWANLPKNLNTENNVFSPDPDNTPYFSLIQIKNGDKVSNYTFSYSQIKRFLTLDKQSATDAFNVKYGVGFKENSIVLSPAMKIGNEEVSELVYDPVAKKYIGKTAQGDVSLNFTSVPPNTDIFMGKEIVNGLSLTNAYISPYSMQDAIAMTNLGSKTISAVKNTGSYTYTLNQVTFYFNYMENGQKINKIVYQLNIGNITHYVDIALGANNTVVLTDKNWVPDFVTTHPDFAPLMTLDKYLTDPKGLYLKRENYTVIYSNPIISLKAASSLAIKSGAFGMSTYNLNP
ncbi:uncharacterized protein DUF4302 [Elizabethkingia sp. YR214]|uniref:DUF4302 domain-containing protein n=1 Tax=Elizabethkingia sp. YR214 TaxID=2135667 RepID=UPI000D3277DE|nr:DUF4302 domain-containing protein [Elizabethkingia sp. YR214]PUB29384.1 uncharacterized protein DUF4302 [Elizabethkingia sp. YR214]